MTRRAILLSPIVILFLIFAYFRIMPIINQTVPFTYDQGRDFIKASEIITKGNLTFIGPTTGISGVYHGAWWYYFLSILYLIFRGWPDGYYLGTFISSFLSVLLFYHFLKREFGYWLSLLFMSIVSISPYLIRTAFYTGNTIIVPSFVLLFIYALYSWTKTKRNIFLFLLFLSIGFILEFEVSFGIFLIPSFILASLFFGTIRSALFKIKNLPLLLIGFGIPVTPRLLFEIKHLFTQTRAFVRHIIVSSPTHPLTLEGSFRDKLHIFSDYISEIFLRNNTYIIAITLFLSILGILFGYKKANKVLQHLTMYFIFLCSIIFGLAVMYKNNFFWTYYLEGIQYIFLFIILMGIFFLGKMSKYILPAVSIAGFLFATVVGSGEIMQKKSVPLNGLRSESAKVKYVYKQAGKNTFCNRIYTPSVIPYTYDYLFNYYSSTKKYPRPTHDYIDNGCWYIIDYESELFQFRVRDWKKDNIPVSARLISSSLLFDNTLIEYWKIEK